jgi:NADPH-dependent glutamate synthase beta subunit-like oxidoreductase
MMNLPYVKYQIDSAILQEAQKDIDQFAKEYGRPKKRLLDIFSYGASLSVAEVKKLWSMKFKVTPKELIVNSEGHLTGVKLGKNQLVGHPPDIHAEPTGALELLNCGILIRSIGYKGEPIEGLTFDETRGLVPNQEGRVLDSSVC